MKLRRGRVLSATFGCNPNSSSLGVDVTFLLFGSVLASALAVVLGSLLRKSRPWRGWGGAAGACGGIARLRKPRALLQVDQQMMRELGFPESPLWNEPAEGA